MINCTSQGCFSSTSREFWLLRANKKGFDEMNCKERLKEYIDKDEIYQDYKQDKLMNCSDFDKFCIQHCKDIEELLEENLELEQALDEIEKYIENHKRESESHIYGLEIPEFIFNGNIEEILKIIQKAKGDVKNEN